MSPEWSKEKAGLPSASGFGKILSPTGLPSKQSVAYMRRLAGELILGTKVESYQSSAMERGIFMEAEARMYYEFINGVDVQEVGIVYKDELKDRSCSPDGLVGEDGGLEIKCPELHTHVEYLLSNKVPTTYIPQIQGSLYITGRKWWDFLSYYPRMKPLIIRTFPDEFYQAKLKRELDMFVVNLKDVVRQLQSLGDGKVNEAPKPEPIQPEGEILD